MKALLSKSHLREEESLIHKISYSYIRSRYETDDEYRLYWEQEAARQREERLTKAKKRGDRMRMLSLFMALQENIDAFESLGYVFTPDLLEPEIQEEWEQPQSLLNTISAESVDDSNFLHI